MAITRYHAPFIPGTTEHMQMDASISGVYVLFREYDQKTKHLEHKIELLLKENDKLRAENLALRFPERRNESLSKDAERYRFARDKMGYSELKEIPGMASGRWDEYIDSLKPTESAEGKCTCWRQPQEPQCTDCPNNKPTESGASE